MEIIIYLLKFVHNKFNKIKYLPPIDRTIVLVLEYFCIGKSCQISMNICHAAIVTHALTGIEDIFRSA